MFPKSKMVRKVIESMYDKQCTVTLKKSYIKENGSTGFKDIQLATDEPCKLSYSSASTAVKGDANATVGQVIKLFLKPEIEIPEGSTITIDDIAYTRSGRPSKHETHQEILLDIKDVRA